MARKKTALEKILKIQPRALGFVGGTKPLSNFQRAILKRERIKKRLSEINPLDRAKFINKGSAFQQQREAIRGVASKAPGLTSFSESPVQKALQFQRDKINAASQGQSIGENNSKIGAKASSRLRAPSRLV